MIVSTTRIGWQTTLADLALILFMVTAAAMAELPEIDAEAEVAHERVEPGNPLPQSGEPLAIYRAVAGAPSLGEWLDSQPRDARQNLTIVARHPGGDDAGSARAALALAREAQGAGRDARIVIEPGTARELIAVLDFDGRQSGTAVAETRLSNIQAAPAATSER